MTEISYVIPTLNSAKTLEMTLLSLRSQNNIKINVIVVDSGSTDGTLEICQRWGVKTLYAEPGNMYRAINVGLRQCQTKWLGYINSDDWLYPDGIQSLIERGENTQADLVYGRCDYTDEGGRFLCSFVPAKPDQLLPLFRSGILGFAQQSTIFRDRLYHQLEGFNEDYFLRADAEFYQRALVKGNKFTKVEGASVAAFRRHKNQLSHTKAQQMQAEKQKMLTAVGQKTLLDRMTLLQWRLKNLPDYAIRILRPSSLENKLKITRAEKIGSQ